MKTFLQWLEHRSDFRFGHEIPGLGTLMIVKHKGVRIPCARDRNRGVWYNMDLDSQFGGSIDKLAKHRNNVYWCRLVNGLGANQIKANELEKYMVDRPTSYDVTEVEGALDIAVRNITHQESNPAVIQHTQVVVYQSIP